MSANDALYRTLGNAISVILTGSAVTMAFVATILGGSDITADNKAQFVPLFVASLLLLISIFFGIISYFRLIVVIKNKYDIYEKPLRAYVAVEQIALLIGVAFVAYFVYIKILP